MADAALARLRYELAAADDQDDAILAPVDVLLVRALGVAHAEGHGDAVLTALLQGCVTPLDSTDAGTLCAVTHQRG